MCFVLNKLRTHGSIYIYIYIPTPLLYNYRGGLVSQQYLNVIIFSLPFDKQFKSFVNVTIHYHMHFSA